MPRHCLTSHTASVDVKHHERRRRKMRSSFRVYTFEPLRVHTASYGRWPGELVWHSGKALAGKQRDVGSNPLRLSFLFKGVVVCGHCLLTSSLTINETLKWLSPLPILLQNHCGGDSGALVTASLFPHLLGSRTPPGPLRRQLHKFNQTKRTGFVPSRYLQSGTACVSVQQT